MDKIVYRQLINNASEEIRRWIDSGFLVNGRDWIESWFKQDLKERLIYAFGFAEIAV